MAIRRDSLFGICLKMYVAIVSGSEVLDKACISLCKLNVCY